MNARRVIFGLWIFAGAIPAAVNAQEQSPLQPVLWQQGPRPGLRRPRPLPPRLLERLQNLPPEERERVLQNNRRFQQLPPERQEELRERLRRLNELSPEQRELIEQRFAIFSNLSPRQQEKAREIYERRWRRMPPERRRALLEQFRRLRTMPPEEREKYLAGKDAEEHFSADEREVLKQLIAL